MPDKSKKVYCSPKHWNYFNLHIFFVSSFLSVQFKYSVQHCVLIKFWSVHVTCFHSSSHFFSFSGFCFEFPLTRTFFDFPEGSSNQELTVLVFLCCSKFFFKVMLNSYKYDAPIKIEIRIAYWKEIMNRNINLDVILSD